MKNRFINFLKVYKPLLITFGVILLVALILGLTCVGVATMDTSSNLAHAEEGVYDDFSYDWGGLTYSGYNMYNPFSDYPINDYGYVDINVVSDTNTFPRNGLKGVFNLKGNEGGLDGYFTFDILDEIDGVSYSGYWGNYTLSFSFGMKDIPESFTFEPIQYQLRADFDNGTSYNTEFYDLVDSTYDNRNSNYLNFHLPYNPDIEPIRVYLCVFLVGNWSGYLDNSIYFSFDYIQLVEGDFELPFSNWYTQLQDINYDVGYDEGYDVGYDEGYNALLNDLTSNFMRYNYNGNANTLYQTSMYIGSISVSSFVDNGDRNNLTITSNAIATGTINEYAVSRYFTVPLKGWYDFSAIFNGVPSANFGILSKFSFYLCNADRTIVLGDSDIVSSSEPYDFSIYVDDTFANSNGSFTIYVSMLIYDYEPPVSGNWNQTWQIKNLTLESADNSLRDEYYTQGYADGERNANNTITTTSASYGAGFDEGYDEGYDVANDTVTTTSASFNAGFNKGVEDAGNYTFNSLLSAVFDVPVRTLLSMLNFEILGVDMSGFFLSLITICVVLFVIRLIMGR